MQQQLSLIGGINPISVVSYDELLTIRNYQDALAMTCGSHSPMQLAKSIGYRSEGKLGEAIREGKGTLMASGEIVLQTLTRRPYIQCWKNKQLGLANITETDLQKLKNELEKEKQKNEDLQQENQRLRELLAEKVLRAV